MALTTLLAVHSTDEPVDSIKPTIELCGNVGAHLNVVVFGTLRTPPTTAYGAMATAYLTDERDSVVRAAQQRAAEVETIVREANLSASVLVECVDAGIVGRIMSRHALYADATVFPHGSLPDADQPTRAFNGILFDSGQPVIVLGDSSKPVPAARRIIMGWNGEPEAARAIHRSLPLLQTAKEVHVVLVDPDLSFSSNAGDDMATFLTRHGLNVTVDQLPGGGREVADVLLQHAVDKDADMLVTGAYGHSRLREWLLGGTTRDLLSRSKLPVLMVH